VIDEIDVIDDFQIGGGNPKNIFRLQKIKKDFLSQSDFKMGFIYHHLSHLSRLWIQFFPTQEDEEALQKIQFNQFLFSILIQ